MTLLKLARQLRKTLATDFDFKSNDSDLAIIASYLLCPDCQKPVISFSLAA
jgi:hypothetical protein